MALLPQRHGPRSTAHHRSPSRRSTESTCRGMIRTCRPAARVGPRIPSTAAPCSERVDLRTIRTAVALSRGRRWSASRCGGNPRIHTGADRSTSCSGSVARRRARPGGRRSCRADRAGTSSAPRCAMRRARADTRPARRRHRPRSSRITSARSHRAKRSAASRSSPALAPLRDGQRTKSRRCRNHSRNLAFVSDLPKHAAPARRLALVAAPLPQRIRAGHDDRPRWRHTHRCTGCSRPPKSAAPPDPRPFAVIGAQRHRRLPRYAPCDRGARRSRERDPLPRGAEPVDYDIPSAHEVLCDSVRLSGST